MLKIIKQNKIIFIIYILLLLVIGFILIRYTKQEIHLFCNKFHSPFFDTFFKIITYLGDGRLIVGISLIFLLIKIRYALIILTSYLFSGIVTQFLKRIIFEDIARPVKYFEGIHQLYLVEGVDIFYMKSFPSGHTTSVFALCFPILFLVKNNFVKHFLLFTAVIVGYSRIYLSQHFLVDIWMGSIIGVFCSMIMYLYFCGLKPLWLEKSLNLKIKKGNDKK